MIIYVELPLKLKLRLALADPFVPSLALRPCLPGSASVSDGYAYLTPPTPLCRLWTGAGCSGHSDRIVGGRGMTGSRPFKRKANGSVWNWRQALRVTERWLAGWGTGDVERGDGGWTSFIVDVHCPPDGQGRACFELSYRHHRTGTPGRRGASYELRMNSKAWSRASWTRGVMKGA